MTGSLASISRRGTRGNTEAGQVSMFLEDCGNSGYRRSHERISDQGAAGSHDLKGSEDFSSPTGASHRRDRADYAGDGTSCSSCIHSADDRGGSAATVYRSGESSSAVDRRGATDSVHRQDGGRSGVATDTGSPKADGTL